MLILNRTINRISFGFTPYRLSKKSSIENPLLLADPLNDYQEIPPILVKSAYGSIVFEKDKHNPYLKTQ
jgi:hypothetical protein